MAIVNKIWTLDGNGYLNTQGPDGYVRTISGTLTVARTYTLPDKSGTFALLSDIPNVTGTAGGVQLLGRLIGANLNSTTDQIITLTGGTKFFIVDVLVTNASTQPNNVQNGQINSGANKTGTTVFDSGTAGYTTYLTTPSSVLDASIIGAMYSGNTPNQVGSTVYYSNGVPQGSICTADIYVYGYVIK